MQARVRPWDATKLEDIAFRDQQVLQAKYFDN